MSNYNIVDRRINPKGKNLPNRKRFIDRARQKIKDKIKGSGNKQVITGKNDEQIVIDIDGIDEPSFSYDPAVGEWEYILPGNREYIPGDAIKKPEGSGGNGGNKAGTGNGEDAFVFNVNKDEYLNIIFEDLELPDLVKQSEKSVTVYKRARAGYTKDGPVPNLALARTLRNSLGRRIALAFPLDRKIKELEELIENTTDAALKITLLSDLEALKIRRLSIAYIDPVDIRYKRFDKFPVPNTQAVMFCLMDVSGSMTEHHKELARRFFLLLFLFLERKYTKVDIIFIRHTEDAEEIDEEEFFYSTQSGGTQVSSSLVLMNDIIKERYDPSIWNLYCVQASDGDNVHNDNPKVVELLKTLLPKFQYYVYNEVRQATVHQAMLDMDSTSLLAHINALRPKNKNLRTVTMNSIADVLPLFRRIFSKSDVKK